LSREAAGAPFEEDWLEDSPAIFTNFFPTEGAGDAITDEMAPKYRGVGTGEGRIRLGMKGRLQRKEGK